MIRNVFYTNIYIITCTLNDFLSKSVYKHNARQGGEMFYIKDNNNICYTFIIIFVGGT